MISVFFLAPWPLFALVVINITPFLPSVPYSVAAARPLSTVTLAMLLGSISKKRLEPVLPLTKLPDELVSLAKGTPSTTNKAWLLPLMEV